MVVSEASPHPLLPLSWRRWRHSTRTSISARYFSRHRPQTQCCRSSALVQAKSHSSTFTTVAIGNDISICSR